MTQYGSRSSPAGAGDRNPVDAAGAGNRNPLDAAGALRTLVAGNDRFLAGAPRHGHWVRRATATAAAQHPFATVVTCLDSRVPPEAIFDANFGDICVVRTGGHTIDRAALGSLEFSVTELRVPLIMVLGHTRCGAVNAAMSAVREGVRPPGALGYVVEQIVPAVQEAGLAGAEADDRAIRRHVRRTVGQLIITDQLAAAHRDGRLAVVGAIYDLDTGRVATLDA